MAIPAGMKRALLPVVQLAQRHLPRQVPYPWRGSAEVRRNLRLLDQARSWDRDQLVGWKTEKVRDVLAHAEQFVPYYRDLFASIGFSSRDFRTLSDLDALPLLTKEIVKENGPRMVSERILPALVERQFTGGSTGEPMAFYVDRTRARIETSFFYFIWRTLGHELCRDRVAYFKADVAPDPERQVFWKYDRFYNYLRFDSNYLNRPEHFDAYRKALEAFDAPVLFGYPSSIHQLAVMYQRTGAAAPRFDLVLLASENVYDWQRSLIESVFRPREVFYHYGHSEEAALAYKLPGSDRLQFVDLYGHVELLDDAGAPVRQAGAMGEIVATAYSRFMPFIRYRTKDFATLSADPVGMFASGPVVDSIEGRLQEFVVTGDERLVSICTIGGFHFPEMRDLMHIQYFQDAPGILHLRYVETPGRPLTAEAQANLVRAFESAMRGSTRLVLDRVEGIALTASNKKSMIVQRLDVGAYLQVRREATRA